jgi:hypothetical protein
MSKLKHDNNGHIVVETIGTFIPLVLLVISILSLVNIVAVQARVHYALTQSAKALSIYTYTLKTTENRSNQTVNDDLSSVAGGIGNIKSTITNIDRSLSTISSLTDITNGSSSVLTGIAVYPIVMRNLTNENISGRDFLKRFGVSDFDLSSSVILDDNDDIKLTAFYKVDYLFGALPLPFGPKLKITQTAVTNSWINGSGTGYIR